MTREEWLTALPRPPQHEYTRCNLDELCSRCMLLWLDRKPPPRERGELAWAEWFVFEWPEPRYLGERSARTGPDDCGGKRCECEVCAKRNRKVET